MWHSFSSQGGLGCMRPFPLSGVACYCAGIHDSSPGSSPGTAVPTGMNTAFVAVVADVSNMTSPLFHCTVMGLWGL